MKLATLPYTGNTIELNST